MKISLLKKNVRGFCPKCGAQIHLYNDVYCMKCGHQLKKHKTKRFGIFKAGIIIVIVIAAIIAIRYFQGKPIIPDFLIKNATK